METIKLMRVNGMAMPFRVDFSSEEAFLAAVEKWNKFFTE